MRVARRKPLVPLLVVIDDLVQVVVLALNNADDEESRFVFELGKRFGVGGAPALGLDERVLDGLLGRLGGGVGGRDARKGIEAVLLEADDRVGGNRSERRMRDTDLR